jgi:hypothetical protein
VANQNKPFGLTPIKYLGGGDWTGQGNIYYIDSTDTNAIYPGDLVALRNGLDAQSGLPSITKATAHGGSFPTAVGVVLGIGASPNTTTSLRGGPYIDPTDLTKTYAPATKTKNYFALVCDDPNVIFSIREASTGTALTKVATTYNADIVVAAPATGVAVSGSYLDNGGTTAPVSGSGGATYNFRMLGLTQILDPGSGLYNTYGFSAQWNVLINNHAYRALGVVNYGV